jgi:putative endonuclease
MSRPATEEMNGHYVYILECSDGTLYTGWTSNIEKRVQEHNNGKEGAKYTRSRRPVALVYVETCASLSDALKREARIKQLSHGGKLELIKRDLQKCNAAIAKPTFQEHV